jgi:hypothetical protein
LARLLLALMLGVPLGVLADGVDQALRHPSFRWLLLHHPLLALPALAAPTIVTGVGALSGLGGAASAAVLRGWMVASAVVVFLWSEHRAG